ncbi:hypothetical protein GCM10020220_114820 [Nonomuraea rubra]
MRAAVEGGEGAYGHERAGPDGARGVRAQAQGGQDVPALPRVHGHQQPVAVHERGGPRPGDEAVAQEQGQQVEGDGGAVLGHVRELLGHGHARPVAAPRMVGVAVHHALLVILRGVARLR